MTPLRKRARKPKRETAEPNCQCGHSFEAHRKGTDVCFDDDCLGCEEYRPTPKRKPAKRAKRRETAEQRARRIGRGLGFYLMQEGRLWWRLDDDPDGAIEEASDNEIALWRALERSQRALARERGKRL